MPVVLHLQPLVSCLENCGSGHDTWYESVNEVEPGLEQVKSGYNQIEIEKEANKTKTRHFFPGDVSASCRPFSLLLQVHQGSAAQAYFVSIQAIVLCRLQVLVSIEVRWSSMRVWPDCRL